MRKVTSITSAENALKRAPPNIRKCFIKQIHFLIHNLHHPSLHAKKYNETGDVW